MKKKRILYLWRELGEFVELHLAEDSLRGPGRLERETFLAMAATGLLRQMAVSLRLKDTIYRRAAALWDRRDSPDTLMGLFGNPDKDDFSQYGL